LAWALFTTLFLTQLLFLEGHINTPDGQMMYKLSEAIIDRGSVAVTPFDRWEEFGGVPVVKGNQRLFYPVFGLGLSLAALPAVAIGKLLAPLAGERDEHLFDDFRDRLDRASAAHSPRIPYGRYVYYDTSPSQFRHNFMVYAATWTNAWVVAGIGTVLFLIGLGMGFGTIPSLVLAFASNFMTPLWHYAGEFFAEPLSALCALVFLWCCRQSFQEGPRRELVALCSGLGLGYAVLTKPANGILLPWAAVYLLMVMTCHRYPWRAAVRRSASVGLGIAGPLLVMGLYNYWRFGSPWETGYGQEKNAGIRFSTPLVTGLYGLTLSPGRGILWYDPLVLLGLLGLKPFWRTWRPEAVFVYGLAASHLALYCKWFMWEGGWCWGPRFLIPVVPLLLLPAVPLAVRCWRKGPLSRWLLCGGAAVASAVSFGAVWVNYNPYTLWVKDVFSRDAAHFAALGYEDYYGIMQFSWLFAPVWRFFVFPVHQEPVLVTAFEYPGLLLVFNLLILAGLGWSIVRLRRAYADHVA